ncbi:aminotransferase class I/II-fold pyridoxal phosphate-dependent enzyme [Herbidospora sp. NEAU-GS84]|uniref:Aminotransferase class I/II-fold pyridoxal phosphate-dependent enzyme n=1 Tax=Herbidospora solisilvae TaxID=2696284 RepID=A0A7C9J6F1_9ACTN|nr:PLP-dependent aminotransferase family protein [Herbidospora solisilvae]NAS25942.1 aminotransferase class I/II-fold pyridoxal phosphate-dependent enzyme [Herbidospora solisilvae]
MRFSEPLTIAIHLDKTSRTPLHAQIEGQLREAIRTGALAHGDRVPSTRALAVALGVSRSVTLHAYHRLFAEGLLEARSGSGNFVCHEEQRSAGRTGKGNGDGHPRELDLTPAGPCSASLPVTAWRSSWRTAAHRPPGHDVLPPRGCPELREALAVHLRRHRGLRCTADQIFITSGRAHALDLLAQVGTRPGDRAAVQEPGPSDARRLLALRGLHTVPLAVDEDGVLVRGPLPDIRLALVSPAQGHPRSRLSVPRRRALIAWARSSGLLLVELEGQAFVQDANPCAPLATSGEYERTAYVGSFRDVLSSALDVGYIISPPELDGPLTDLLQLIPSQPPLVAQRALAGLLREGHLARHVRRLTAAHAARTRLVRKALLPLRGQVDEVGFDGLNAFVHFRHLPAGLVADRLRRRGVLVGDGSAHCFSEGRHNSIVIGCARLDELSLQRGLSTLVAVVGELRERDGSLDEATSA